ncbi:MAG: glycoside hydrolase family 127 protein [Ruminococcaceae bacterium]|nr:glycoside hydrolase family 127 protein [Oscillospiraceae bacterium]
MKKTTPVSFANVEITNGFWAKKQELNRTVTLDAVRKQFENTGRFEAFKFNWTEDSDLPQPHIFWDSDIAKWMESAALILRKHSDPELEKKVDEIVDLIEKNQGEDGYFNIFFTVCEPEGRWQNRDAHELYCAGHLTEAAVAYYEATGKIKFLKLMCKYMDYIAKVFAEEKSTAFATPGHEEIELALIKLYRCTSDERFLKLARFFIDERGKETLPITAWCNTKYNQSHMPVREQRTAEGHSVRACYLYSGMADLAKEIEDEELLVACKALFDNIVQKRMYITGGVGSSHEGEAFTVDYDLQNDTAYAETCAAISLAMFANRLKEIDMDSKYADIVEKVYYNGFLSGISLDGKAFFYENPLEILKAEHNRHASVNKSRERFPITRRQEVFSCSCCPPNITRFIAAFGDYMYSFDAEMLYVHQFAQSNANFAIGSNSVSVVQKTEYPNDGKLTLTVTGLNGKKLAVRIPFWSVDTVIDKPYTVEKGYAVIDVTEDVFAVEIEFDMTPRIFAAHPLVFADNGRFALQSGPLVYCLESEDNGENLRDIAVLKNGTFTVHYDEFFGVNVITAKAQRTDVGDCNALYRPVEQMKTIETDARFIPYFGFANRSDCDMLVWFKLA